MRPLLRIRSRGDGSRKSFYQHVEFLKRSILGVSHPDTSNPSVVFWISNWGLRPKSLLIYLVDIIYIMVDIQDNLIKNWILPVHVYLSAGSLSGP